MGVHKILTAILECLENLHAKYNEKMDIFYAFSFRGELIYTASLIYVSNFERLCRLMKFSLYKFNCFTSFLW